MVSFDNLEGTVVPFDILEGTVVPFDILEGTVAVAFFDFLIIAMLWFY